MRTILPWAAPLFALLITPAASAEISINEAVAKATDDGPDWVELYNSGTDSISLDGWSIRDADGDEAHPDHVYNFPAGTALGAGEFLYVERGDDGFDFGLGGEDGVFLFAEDGTSVDSTLWSDGENPAGQSWGRSPDGSGSFATLLSPTPGAANSGIATPEPTLEDSDYIFDKTVRQYELIMTDEDWQWLQDNATLEEYVPGYIVFEEETIGPVGIRFKGSAGSLYGCFDDEGNQTCDKLSMKISFHEYTDGGRFYGMKKLQFHAMMNDLSKMHDELGYGLFTANGVKAPRTSHSNLIINGENYGLFQLIEQIDSQFARHHYSDGGEGNVYKEVWPVHFDEQSYINALETNEDEAEVAAFVNFAEELEASDRRTFRDTLSARMDVQQLMSFLVVDRSINNWDGIMGWYGSPTDNYNHNYFWYEGEDQQTFTLIPWDLDFTFSEESIWSEWLGVEWDPWYETPNICIPSRIYGLRGLYPAGCDTLIGGVADNYWNEYTDALQVFQSGLFAEQRMIESIDILEEKLRPHVEADPWLSVTEWEGQVQVLRDEIPVLRAKMSEEIAR